MLKFVLLTISILFCQTLLAQEERKPWTCYELEQYTDPFYRMFPSFLGSAHLDKEDSFVLDMRTGRCYLNITVFTTYTMNPEETNLKARVVFDLKNGIGMCTEHLQVSTSFTDHYDFYFFGG